MCHTRNHGKKWWSLNKIHANWNCDMQKIYPQQQGRIYPSIFPIIWHYKKNFHKTIWGISKSLLFLLNNILESSMYWFLWKQSGIFWKSINFTPLDCIVPEVWCATDWQIDEQMGRQMDKQKKWHIEVGSIPKKCAIQKHLYRSYYWHCRKNIKFENGKKI